jgi:hypothetical protein
MARRRPSPVRYRRGPPEHVPEPEVGKTAARLTLLTVIVSAIVGLGSAFLAYRSNQDVQEHAAQTQQQAAANTRFQADLLELRSVLDGALADLSVARASVQARADAWESGDAADIERAQESLRTALVRTRANAARLRIRLGRQGPYMLYWFAYHEYIEAGRCTDDDAYGDFDTTSRQKAVAFLIRSGVWLGDWFSDLAFASAQSALRDQLAGAPTEAQIAEAKRNGGQSEKALLKCGKALNDAVAGKLPETPSDYWNNLPDPPATTATEEPDPGA